MKTIERLMNYMDKHEYQYTNGFDQYGDAIVIHESCDEHEKIEKELYRLCTLKTADVGKYVINLYYDDECVICDNCGKIISTQTYSLPQYYADYDTCEMTCADCVHKDPTEYIHYLNNQPTRANTILSMDELYKANYEKISVDYENGMYEGMNDNPNTIFEELSKTHKNIIFDITAMNPFMISFTVYVRNEEWYETSMEVE